MKQFYLTEITTKDKLIHQGLYYEPKIKSKTALMWVHGLTGNFYGNSQLFEKITDGGEIYGYGFAAFNNRGHDFVTGAKKINRRKKYGYEHAIVGAGLEIFTDCLLDIDAGITFLKNLGYDEVILIGASTGANKVCYYAGKIKDQRVKGVVLVSPISDRLLPEKDSSLRAEEVLLMKGLVRRGKGDELMMGHHYFPITPKRYLSLFSPGNEEDIFDYGDAYPKLKYFYKITMPLLVVFGSLDESRDRPIGKIKKVFDAHYGSIKYASVVIKDAGHGFDSHEEDLTEAIIDWVNLL